MSLLLERFAVFVLLGLIWIKETIESLRDSAYIDLLFIMRTYTNFLPSIVLTIKMRTRH